MSPDEPRRLDGALAMVKAVRIHSKDRIDLVDPVEVGLHNLSTGHVPTTNPLGQIHGGLVWHGEGP